MNTSNKTLQYFYKNNRIMALFAILLCYGSIHAQPQKGKFINAVIGYGMSAPNDEVDIIGTGFYAQGEYVMALKKWFGIRPYAGFIVTSENDNTSLKPPQYKVTTKAFMLGTKVRVIAPIPWFAPYFEIGLGISLGKFETLTPAVREINNGLLTHIPITLGVALGKNNSVDIAFVYYFHNNAEQFSAVVAVGLLFPLNKKNHTK